MQPEKTGSADVLYNAFQIFPIMEKRIFPTKMAGRNNWEERKGEESRESEQGKKSERK